MRQQAEQLMTSFDVAAGKLPDHVWMDQDLIVFQPSTNAFSGRWR